MAITNAARGEAEITLGGKARKLKFGMAQMCELEEYLGDQSILDMLQKGRFNFRALCHATTVGLRAFDKSVGLEQVQGWVQDLLDAEQHKDMATLTSTVQGIIMCSVAGPKHHENIRKSILAVQSKVGGEAKEDAPKGDAPRADIPLASDPASP